MDLSKARVLLELTLTRSLYVTISFPCVEASNLRLFMSVCMNILTRSIGASAVLIEMDDARDENMFFHSLKVFSVSAI